uniref:Secreted protein n=1 Tax=Piliocolobus tephrosceles TaxID=591936 RepID=A0A8C9GWY3_9PRIM
MPNFAKSPFIHPVHFFLLFSRQSCSVSQAGVGCSEPGVWCTPVWVTRVKLHLKNIYISTTN